MGIPGNVQPWQANFVRPSDLCNSPNVYGKVENYIPFLGIHPSGIPPPSSPSKLAALGTSSGVQTDGLELKIGQPQSKQASTSSGPIIRVT